MPDDSAPTGMDRIKSKPTQSRRLRWIAAGAGLLVAILAVVALRPGGGAVRRIEADAVTLGEVKQGPFEDFIPIRGRVTPAETVYLDAVEGGRVEQVLVEDGARVEAGQPLLVLSNTQLQLDVIAREAAVEEQLNNLRTLELELQRNRLSHARAIVDINARVSSMEKNATRRRMLAERGVIPRVQLEEAEDDLAAEQQRRDVAVEAQDTDARLARTQAVQLRASTERLNTNLELARRNLDSLNVRAPIAGDLTSFTADVGQSLQRGERLGQIDTPGDFKLRASVDEFFIARVDNGLVAEIQNAEAGLASVVVDRVYPQVNEGQFEIDLRFEGERPANLRRGQTLQLRLVLGAPEPALLAPAGAWLADTGGNWAFVADRSGGNARRRTIRTGRRNTQFVEVLEGLESGERIVTSSYAAYADADRIRLAQ